MKKSENETMALHVASSCIIGQLSDSNMQRNFYFTHTKHTTMQVQHSKLRKIISMINLPEKVLTTLLGKKHPLIIRLFLGAGIMLLGCFISHQSGIIYETGGWLIHATGASPYLDAFVSLSEEN